MTIEYPPVSADESPDIDEEQPIEICIKPSDFPNYFPPELSFVARHKIREAYNEGAFPPEGFDYLTYENCINGLINGIQQVNECFEHDVFRFRKLHEEPDADGDDTTRQDPATIESARLTLSKSILDYCKTLKRLFTDLDILAKSLLQKLAQGLVLAEQDLENVPILVREIEQCMHDSQPIIESANNSFIEFSDSPEDIQFLTTLVFNTSVTMDESLVTYKKLLERLDKFDFE